MAGFEIGFGKCDITPDKDRQTIYTARAKALGREAPEEIPIQDRLWARATAFKSGDAAAVWITLDVLCVDTPLHNRIADALAGHGIPAAGVNVGSTHTHAAATVIEFMGRDPTPEGYVTLLAERSVAAALEAIRSAKSATVSFGSAPADLNVNRREIGRIAKINDINAPTGLVDPEVHVVRIETEDGRVGLLFNYAAHPLTTTKDPMVITSDFPGRTVERLESADNVVFAQFLQGCSGNVNVKIHGGPPETDRVAETLAGAVLAASESAQLSQSCELRAASTIARIPWGWIPTLEEARAALAAAQSGQPLQKPVLPWQRPERIEKLVRTLEAGPPPECIEVLVQALRLGDGVLVALPGEVFLEIGLAIRERAGTAPVLAVAYANSDEVGYVPTASAFPEGGYEVDQAPYYYGIFQLSPECERVLVEAGLEVVRAVG